MAVVVNGVPAPVDQGKAPLGVALVLEVLATVAVATPSLRRPVALVVGREVALAVMRLTSLRKPGKATSVGKACSVVVVLRETNTATYPMRLAQAGKVVFMPTLLVWGLVAYSIHHAPTQVVAVVVLGSRPQRLPCLVHQGKAGLS